MAATIKIKNSSTASAVPTSSDLVQGELAVNVTDKRIFTENASGTVVELGINPSTITTATVNGLTVGYGAGSVSSNTAVGASTLNSNTTGLQNTAVGQLAMRDTTTGQENTALGRAALYQNTTGSTNTAIGVFSLSSNTTASGNTAVGYQAGYSNTTNAGSTFIGYLSGYASTGLGNTLIGYQAGTAITTGAQNNFFGTNAGYLVTTGSKNVILGQYSGNQGGLDIRTASNYIVLADGDGNPRQIINDSGQIIVGATSPNGTSVLTMRKQSSTSTTKASNTVALFSSGTATSADAHIICTDYSAYSYYFGGRGGVAYVTVNNNQGVSLAVGATAWSADSDERLKNIKAPIVNAVENLSTLRTVYGNYKTDDESVSRLFLIAQDVEKVYPELVDTYNGDELEDTKTLRSTDLIPVLVAAIKELKAEIDILKGQA